MQSQQAVISLQPSPREMLAMVSLTNGRGSRVAGPKSRSRVQCRGRGSNVAAGENDFGVEVTEWKRPI